MSLKVDLCEYDAAKYAVMHWHYSKAMPSGKLVRFGVWEDKRFIGCVIFGRGATINIGRPYNLKQTRVCELVRVALNKHQSPVTKIVSQAIKILKETNPGMELIVSYADSNQGHTGVIYQAGNWIYEGYSTDSNIIIKGKLLHRRSITAKYGTNSLEWIQNNVDPKAERVLTKPKYKYLMPLNKRIKKQIQKLSKPYPKSVKSIEADALSFQDKEGGSIPTLTLHQ